MRFVSTRDATAEVDLPTAIFEGLARDGGLLVPTAVPRVPALDHPGGTSLTQLGRAMLHPFLEELSGDQVETLVASSLDFPFPVTPLDDRIHLLELFHGPTHAFKDVGARFLARLMSQLRTEDAADLTILVATSGDTGGAVAQAFHGVPGIRVAVLFPRGKVSPLQEKQFSTLGGNVHSYAVEGTFDDCQRLVRSAFAAAPSAPRLGSANSINLGRLLPQSIYYALAAGNFPEPVTFVTPSGNFGNLTAGLLAEAMGLRCAGFVAATNLNDVVPEYLRTGEFQPRPSVATVSNAMDVGDPSNLDRIRWLFDQDLSRLRARVQGRAYDDDATRACIAEVYRTTGIVIDPHTAVGVLAARDSPAPGPHVVLATAHPAKFLETVQPLVDVTIELPPGLARCAGLASQAIPLDNRLEALLEALRGWS